MGAQRATRLRRLDKLQAVLAAQCKRCSIYGGRKVNRADSQQALMPDTLVWFLAEREPRPARTVTARIEVATFTKVTGGVRWRRTCVKGGACARLLSRITAEWAITVSKPAGSEKYRSASQFNAGAACAV